MEKRSEQEQITSIELQGGPWERGFTHGDNYSEEIHENLDTYLQTFEHYGAKIDEVYDKADEFKDIIESANKDYFAEMEGISEGADIDLIDIIILNARYEVMYSAFEDSTSLKGNGPIHTDGCTALGILPERTVEGHTYLTQNWDWLSEVHSFVMNVTRPDGPNFVAMTEAGIVGGKVGVNEHSIGLGINGLAASNDGRNPYQVPYHVRFREVLDSTRFDKAIGAVISTNRANSANVLLGHGEGELLDIEITPETSEHLYPENGLLAHANHFEGSKSVDSTLEKITPDTLYRCSRVRRLSEQWSGNVTIEDIKTVLRDHFGHPASVCSHVDPEAVPEEQTQTNGSYILELDTCRMYATDGPPCESEYGIFDVQRTVT